MEALRILSILSVIGKEVPEFIGTVDTLFGLSESNLERPEVSPKKNVSLEKVSLQRLFLENLTFVMSNDSVSRICLWNRETVVATSYSPESVITTTLSPTTHFLGAISASM